MKKISTLNVKNGRSGECENKSMLNVKRGRSGKCEKKSTLNVEKKFGQLHDQSNGQFGQFGQLFFSAFSGFGVSTFQKLKILGSVMIFRESVK